jgi:glutamyl-tRNA synthetase
MGDRSGSGTGLDSVVAELDKLRESLARQRRTQESVEEALRGVAERLAVKPKAVFQPLRVALTGTTVSPGIFETVALLGRDETLARVDDALDGREAA